MEEKDTSIALLEISDGSHCHHDEIVELQQQNNMLMRMMKQHVSVIICVLCVIVTVTGRRW